MVRKVLSVVALTLLLLGLVAESSAQYRRTEYGYGYRPVYTQQQQQQVYPGYGRPQYQQQYQPVYQGQGQQQVTVQEAEWVCKNPKTGDMMIIASEQVPSGTGQGQWQQQQPNYGPTQPPSAHQPQFGPPSQQPTYPPTEPTYPTVPNGPTYPTYPPTHKPGQGQHGGTTPNTNGNGLIDIRLGEK